MMIWVSSIHLASAVIDRSWNRRNKKAFRSLFAIILLYLSCCRLPPARNSAPRRKAAFAASHTTNSEFILDCFSLSSQVTRTHTEALSQRQRSPKSNHHIAGQFTTVRLVSAAALAPHPPATRPPSCPSSRAPRRRPLQRVKRATWPWAGTACRRARPWGRRRSDPPRGWCP